MLKNTNSEASLAKKDYKRIIPAWGRRLGNLQRKCWELKIPILILFEGWSASGKGTIINNLLGPLDPRGFKVYTTNPPNEEERFRPFLWRFWIKTPARGRVTIFDRSWYQRVLTERVDGLVTKKECQQAYEAIGSFERHLVDDKTIIIKFFLHITKKEQKKRFKELESNPATAWRVTKTDWEKHKQYSEYRAAADEMLQKTDTRHAPWTIVEALDERYATAKVFRSVITRLEKQLRFTRRQLAVANSAPSLTQTHPIRARISRLDRVDLTQSLDKASYEKQLKKEQLRLRDIEYDLYRHRIPMIILYEGWDAAGKGGNVKRLTRELDPRGYEVVPIAAPTDIELSHHYLWRFWTQLPKAGHISIFDRTWYGRVLVERVEGLCTEQEWKRGFQEINELEQQLTHFGTVVVKFWLHITPKEQWRRFEEREKTPHKRWKLTPEDYRNRKKWDAYQQAIDEMLLKTSTPSAPWTVVEANCKYFARIKTLRTVIQACEKALNKK